VIRGYWLFLLGIFRVTKGKPNWSYALKALEGILVSVQEEQREAFSRFLVDAEPRLRHALMARYGLEVERESTADALAYACGVIGFSIPAPLARRRTIRAAAWRSNRLVPSQF